MECTSYLHQLSSTGERQALRLPCTGRSRAGEVPPARSLRLRPPRPPRVPTCHVCVFARPSGCGAAGKRARAALVGLPCVTYKQNYKARPRGGHTATQSGPHSRHSCAHRSAPPKRALTPIMHAHAIGGHPPRAPTPHSPPHFEGLTLSSHARARARRKGSAEIGGHRVAHIGAALGPPPLRTRRRVRHLPRSGG